MTKKKSTPAKRSAHRVLLMSAGRETGARFDKTSAKKRISFLLDLLCDTPSSVNIRFCGLEEMRHTNASFRKKDKPTDVLSFPAMPGQREEYGDPASQLSLGDLLVCIPVCASQARTRRHSLAREVERMIVHGLVHLRGLDHERGDAAWRVMSALEKALLRELDSAFGKPQWAIDTESDE